MGDEKEKLLVEWAKSHGEKSFQHSDIEKAFPEMSKQDSVGLLNLLIAKGIIAVEQVTGKNQLVYRYKGNAGGAEETGGMEGEEKIIYRIIKEAGNKGIWMRDIRFKSHILPNQLNKHLKSLENKKIIKSVKSVSAYKKKVYMLYDVEPDSTLTGGSWYCDQDFESEFVDVLNQQCYRYLVHLGKKARDSLPSEGGSGSGRSKKGSGGPLAVRNMASALPNEVCKYIKDLGISKIVLSEEDIKTILDTLVYDGKVQKKRVMSGEEAYWASNSLLPSPGLTVIPCSVCPAVYNCHSNTILTSIDCQHLTTWSEKIDNTKHMAEF